jgi:hypothetical protein
VVAATVLVSASTRISAVVAVILLSGTGWTMYRILAGHTVVLRVPVSLHTGDIITHTFSVDRAASYYLEIECDRTREQAEAGNDLDDALEDGLEADANITTVGHPIDVNCLPGHYMGSVGFYSRVLCTFQATPGRAYSLALHIIRYGQGLSSRDHKLAGTWDENLIIPEEAHPRLKIEIDPLTNESDGILVLVLGAVDLICVIWLFKLSLSRLRQRTRPPT